MLCYRWMWRGQPHIKARFADQSVDGVLPPLDDARQGLPGVPGLLLPATTARCTLGARLSVLSGSGFPEADPLPDSNEDNRSGQTQTARTRRLWRLQWDNHGRKADGPRGEASPGVFLCAGVCYD
jgi:hypothetical protein